MLNIKLFERKIIQKRKEEDKEIIMKEALSVRRDVILNQKGFDIMAIRGRHAIMKPISIGLNPETS